MTAATGTIYVPDEGALAYLADIFRSGNDFALRLFVSDTTPADGDTAATYTEAAGGGYVPKTLLGSNWTISIVGGIAVATYNTPQTFTLSGALTGNAIVYGPYITDSNGKVRGAARMTPQWQPDAVGGVHTFTPTIQMSKGTPT